MDSTLDKEKQVSIGVVIITYQRYDELELTINAILREGVLLNQIFVIDNNQGNNLDKGFYKSFSNINVVYTSSNIASSGGFALGMAKVHEAGYDWALLFNDDSRPLLGAISSFYSALDQVKDQNPGLLKIGNLNVKGEAIVLQWKGVRKPYFYPVSNKVIPCDLVTFDGCFVSKSLMDQIGYCDPEYFMGTYEFDYCLKAKDNEFSIFTIPNGLIEDDKLGSVNGTPPWRQYYNTRNHLHLGISRKDWRIIWAWVIREAKFTYAILRFQNNKRKRLKFKILAMLHAIRKIRGCIIIPQTK